MFFQLNVWIVNVKLMLYVVIINVFVKLVLLKQMEVVKVRYIYIFCIYQLGFCLNKINRIEIIYNFGVNFILKMDKVFIIFIIFLFQKNVIFLIVYDLYCVLIINVYVIEDML